MPRRARMYLPEHPLILDKALILKNGTIVVSLPYAKENT